MMSLIKKIFNQQSGQAMVEYALLLALTTLTITAFLNLDDKMKVKVRTIAEDFSADVILLPDGEVHKPPRDLELSPPVAQFNAPSPNYKGREILFADSSYDVDGYVEHWRWKINGQDIKRSKTEIERDGGLKHTFRNTGTYTVSLFVFDNDGLVSNVVTKTISIVNRAPEINVTAQNQEGVTGTNITVAQTCKATFFTTYSDPDLPFETVFLQSRFVDHTGVVSTDDSAPHQFTREFVNLGTYTYTVTITDEDGASASATATVTVVPNVKGYCDANDLVKPTYSIQVFDQNGVKKTPVGGNVYMFNEGDEAYVHGIVKWGSLPAHATAYYFRATQDGKTNFDRWQNTNILKQPATVKFKRGDKPITVMGMARDTSATSNVANPSLQGMSNQDTVILMVDSLNQLDEPIATISYNSGKEPSSSNSEANKTTTFDVSKQTNKFVEITIESNLSKAFSGQTNVNNSKITGVRWKLPDGSWAPKANASGAFYDQNQKKWYYSSTVNSPDSKVKLIWAPTGKNFWDYELEVVNSLKMVATTKKKFVIQNNDADKPPVAVCNPKEATSNMGQPIPMNASGSTDDKGTVQARWSLDNFNNSASAWQPPNQNVPSNEVWNNLKEGRHTIYLEVRDNANQTTKAECFVTVKKITDTSNKIRPEVNYIEHRVRFATQEQIPFVNRTNTVSGFDKTKVHYTIWSNELYTTDSGKFGPNYTINYVGASSATAVSENPHTNSASRKNLITTSTPGAYRIYIYAADADGIVASNDCVAGSIFKVDVYGKVIDACGKGTFYFRFGQQIAGGEVQAVTVSGTEAAHYGVNWSGSHSSWRASSCHKIAKYMNVYHLYESAYQGGGSWDKYEQIDVRARIEYMLRGC